MLYTDLKNKNKDNQKLYYLPFPDMISKHIYFFLCFILEESWTEEGWILISAYSSFFINKFLSDLYYAVFSFTSGQSMMILVILFI